MHIPVSGQNRFGIGWGLEDKIVVMFLIESEVFAMAQYAIGFVALAIIVWPASLCGDAPLVRSPLASPNRTPGLEQFNGLADTYSNWSDEFDRQIVKAGYDLKAQVRVKRAIMEIVNHPFEHLSTIAEGLDDTSYCMTAYYPGNMIFGDLTVEDVSGMLTRLMFDDIGIRKRPSRSYVNDVIYGGEPPPEAAKRKAKFAEWLSARRNRKPWEIQLEVLEWHWDQARDQFRRESPPEVIPHVKMDRDEYFKYYNRDSKELFRRISTIKAAQTEIQFAVVNVPYDLIDYLTGKYEAK